VLLWVKAIQSPVVRHPAPAHYIRSCHRDRARSDGTANI
jgi:hypothetical protein